MKVVLLAVVTFAGYLVAYHTYGRYLGRKIFRLRPDALTPSQEKNDGIDYVPTRRGIIFGHHYTSIAGTGPIVGPAIGIIWGWVPALIWVFVGSIVMGAVHDFGAIVVSMRNEGKSISECAAEYMGPRVRYLFFAIVFLLLLIVIAVFGIVIATVFSLYPGSVFPVWMEIPIAIGLGWAVYKRKWNVVLMTVLAVAVMYITVVMGHFTPIQVPPMLTADGIAALEARPENPVPPEVLAKTGPLVDQRFAGSDEFSAHLSSVLSEEEFRAHGNAILKRAADAGFAGVPTTGVWVIILLVYAFVASSLPITSLLQPRDYINAWQLFIAMALLVAGVFASGLAGDLEMAAPKFNIAQGETVGSYLFREHHTGAPPMLPFLFVVIACGAISGFHALVGSGTTSKQVMNENDARFVGYGSMLLEAALATLAIIAVAAGIGMATEAGATAPGAGAWHAHYSSFNAANGLVPKIKAVVDGSANMLMTLGIPRHLGLVMIGVFVASFAGTTLDTATRIQRYAIGELFSGMRLKFMANRHVAGVLAVATAAGLAFATGGSGSGAVKLWPMFGAANQLLAALALLVMTNYLVRRGRSCLVTAIPCMFMSAVTIWAAVVNELDFVGDGNWLLVVINGIVLVLAVWIIAEGIAALVRSRRTATVTGTKE